MRDLPQSRGGGQKDFLMSGLSAGRQWMGKRSARQSRAGERGSGRGDSGKAGEGWGELEHRPL